MEHKNEAMEIDLLGLFFYLKKRLWIIASALVILALSGYIVSAFFTAPQYTATTRMYVLNRSSENYVGYSDFQTSNYVLNDYKGLITGQNVTKKVIEEEGLTISPGALAAKIHVSSPENTRILQISVTDTNPVLAAELANSIREVASVQIKDIMDVDAVKLVYEADIPSAPSSPNVLKNTLIAAALGAFGAIAVLSVIYLLDDTIRTEEDTEKWLQLSVLGVIPIAESLNTTGKSRAASKPKPNNS